MEDETSKSLIPTPASSIVRLQNNIELTNKLLKESRDRNLIPHYKSLKIGEHEWMIDNLNIDTFANGDSILEVRSKKEWLIANENEIPAWCCYDNDLNNGLQFGKLYNWYAANDARNLAPVGYYIPTSEEWTKLARQLESNYTLNELFTSLPGCRFANGDFTRDGLGTYFGKAGFWWTSENKNDNFEKKLQSKSTYFTFSNKVGELRKLYANKSYGFSIRCLKK